MVVMAVMAVLAWRGIEALVRTRDIAQASVELDQRVADEGHAPVVPGQSVQDVGVEDEHAPDAAAGLERVVQGGVVLRAQVAAEPYEGSLEGHYFGVFRVEDKRFFAARGLLWPLASCHWRRCGGNSV